MPAPFAAELCGYRTVKKTNSLTDKPNMSDATDPLSVSLGKRLLDALGVSRTKPTPNNPGGLLQARIVAHLASVRKDLTIQSDGRAESFAQYAHLAVLRDFLDFHKRPSERAHLLRQLIAVAPKIDEYPGLHEIANSLLKDAESEASLIAALKSESPLESFLKLDVAVGVPSELHMKDLLAVGVSCKWSLRTDRAQDCVTQGNKLVAQRRGRMPHYAAITMETRPAMLRILGDGSGSIDCVYHLSLDALAEAIASEANDPKSRSGREQQSEFRRLVGQGRLRDYDQLVSEVVNLPAKHSAPSSVEAADLRGERHHPCG